MKEFRGSSSARGSRTAAVVMLVVFLQVLVVAVLGLGAISRDREEARRAALEAADFSSKDTLDRLVAWAEREVQVALVEAKDRTSWRELVEARQGAHHGHAHLTRTIYQYDRKTGEFFGMDGRHRLYVPDARRLLLIEQEKGKENDARQHDHPHNRSLSPEEEYAEFLWHLQEVPYRRDEAAYLTTLGYAQQATGVAQEHAEINGTRDAYAKLEEVLLSALEVVYLNRDRERLAPTDVEGLDRAEQFVQSVVMAISPEEPMIAGNVEAFGEARRRLLVDDKALLRAMEETVRGAGERPDPVLREELSYLVGLAPGAGLNDRDVLVEMDKDAVRALLEDDAPEETLRSLSKDGVRLQVVKDTPDNQARPDGLIAQQGLRPRLAIPYRAELVRIRAPVLPAGGPAEFFYWGIILLAGGGLAIGGAVLARLYTREVKLARLKADFVSNLSHELKTPITSISIFTEMLQDGKLTDPADQAEGFAILAQESERLQRIVARMLDVAKREARGIPYDLAGGDLNQPVEEAVERFRRIVTEEGLHLTLSLTRDPLPVRMDLEAINDVVTNLVSNAWKYRRGEEARVAVRTARRGRRAEIVVSDDGVGIPRRERRRVFEMFYRADAYLNRSVPGTGIGLSLVRTIVRAHGGTIRIESGEGGQGTLFRIRFPLDRSARAAHPFPLPAPSPQPEAKTTS